MLVTDQPLTMQYKARPKRNWGRTLKGYAFGWAWFDPVSSWALRRLFVPSSLLWAAAEQAGTSVEHFFDAAQLPRKSVSEKKLAEALVQTAAARTIAQAKEAEWQKAFFGNGTEGPETRREIEASRYAASHTYNLARRHFGFMLRNDPPRIKSQTQNPEEIAAIYGANFERLSLDGIANGNTAKGSAASAAPPESAATY